jgi:hypothetical protein
MCNQRIMKRKNLHMFGANAFFSNILIPWARSIAQRKVLG